MDTTDHLHDLPAIEALLQRAIDASRLSRRLVSQMLEDLPDQRRGLAIAERWLEASVAALWARGWSPADLAHVVSRRLGSAHGRVVTSQVLADGWRRTEHGESLHPRWQRELAVLEGVPGGAPLRVGQLYLVIEVLGLVARLPDLPAAVPPPGSSWSTASASRTDVDPALLSRVRALLAKAESTDFEAEADAFTAKAQELMARHAIDEALLRTPDTVGAPDLRRLPVHDPYADPKAALIGQVADVNRCRAVYTANLGLVTVFGYDHDLRAVELLSISLLTQATTAMVRYGSRRDPSGRSVTRSFRRAFLLGFAGRIGQRLRQATEAETGAAGAGERLLPVLSARHEQVAAAQERAFPRLARWSPSASNTAGWVAGELAADQADVSDRPSRRLEP